MIVRWPGEVIKNSVVDAVVSNVDIYPTILTMAGLDLPSGQEIEGRDLIPFLKGVIEDDPKPVFAQYNMENFGIAKLRMIRVGNWKMVKRFGLSANSILVDELYDLNSDPSENNNLISHPDHQTRRLELNMDLQNWMIKIKDPAL